MSSERVEISLLKEDGSWRVAGDLNPIPVTVGGAGADAFNRARVSEPQTLFDSKQLFDKAPLLWDDKEVSGTGTSSVHSTAEASTVIGVGTDAGKRVRQTFMRFNYQPGKSQQILMTGTLNLSGGGTGILCAFGIFDDNNGIFLKREDGVTSVVIRSSTSGSVVDNPIAQTDWDDQLDGEGRSRQTLDITMSQLLIIDYEWLSVGTVRLGLVFNGQITYFHEFHHANIVEGAYMSTPNLPLRYEIENDGTGVASTLRHICSTVISEGGIQERGVLRWASTAGAGVITDNEDELFAVIGIQLKSSHLDAQVKLVKSELQIQTTGEFGEWVLIFNPTVAGTFTYAAQTNSAVGIALGAGATNSVTGGTQITGGFAETAGGQIKSGTPTSGGDLDNALLLGSLIDGTADTIVLCYRPINTTIVATVEGGLGWREAV